MSKVIQDPVCIITGGSSGIGLATARKFYGAGYRIAICGRSQERLSEAARVISDNALIDHKRLLTIVADLEHAEPLRCNYRRLV